MVSGALPPAPDGIRGLPRDIYARKKGWGWEGMDKYEGAIPGATRSWYSEIKNDYNYATGKGNGQAVGHSKQADYCVFVKVYVYS